MLNRRALLRSGLLSTAIGIVRPAIASTAPSLQFPRDHGAHPETGVEWWYITGYAAVGNLPAALGFQVTFFRRRVDANQALRSTLAAKQLIFAHAAITDVQGQTLWHDQRIARSTGDETIDRARALARASTRTTDLALGDWTLRRAGDTLTATVRAAEFSMALTLTATQPLMLQGDAGQSRKGPDVRQMSSYYSQPQLQVSGELHIQGRRSTAGPASRAWLDHEWSNEVLHPDARGWDWIGINLTDGSALMAFQIRDDAGRALWDGGALRTGAGQKVFRRGETQFEARRFWVSQASGARYPVQWRIQTPAGLCTVTAVVDNQELDSRASTGAVYWEGLCEVHDDSDRLIGRGYLEMTGYAAPLKL
jgi:predicted secreted hydrolase